MRETITYAEHGMFWHWHCDFVELQLWHRIQDLFRKLHLQIL